MYWVAILGDSLLESSEARCEQRNWAARDENLGCSSFRRLKFLNFLLSFTRTKENSVEAANIRHKRITLSIGAFS